MGNDRTGAPTSPHGISRVLKAAGLLLVGGLVLLLIMQAKDATCTGDGNDLTSYCLSSRALFQGGNPYATGSPFPYIYPLFLAVVIAPLTGLPCTLMALIWIVIGLGALAGTMAILRRHTPVPMVMMVGLCLVLFDVIQNNAVNGQVNFLVLFLGTVGFHFSTRGHRFPAALAMGAAAAIKLTPLILLCYLAARRQWLAAGATILVFLLLCLFPGLVPGIDLRVSYGEYGRDFLLGQLTEGTPTQGHAIFSLAGILTRAGLPLGFDATVVFLLFIPGAVLLWDIRTRKNSDQTGKAHNDLRAFCLYMMTPLFVVPMSEVHHLIQALPAYYFLGAMAKLSGAPNRWILPSASLAVYLIGALIWREGPLYFLSLVILFFGVMSARQPEKKIRFSGQRPETRSCQTGDPSRFS